MIHHNSPIDYQRILKQVFKKLETRFTKNNIQNGFMQNKSMASQLRMPSPRCTDQRIIQNTLRLAPPIGWAKAYKITH